MDNVSGKWKVFLENSLPTLLEYNFQCPRSQVLVVSCSLLLVVILRIALKNYER